MYNLIIFLYLASGVELATIDYTSHRFISPSSIWLWLPHYITSSTWEVLYWPCRSRVPKHGNRLEKMEAAWLKVIAIASLDLQALWASSQIFILSFWASFIVESSLFSTPFAVLEVIFAHAEWKEA